MLPNGTYNIWVSSPRAASPGGATIQKSAIINGANAGVNIN